MASYSRSQFLLQLPPTQQDLSYGPDAIFFLAGSPNRQWKIGPNRDWFIALQPEPRTTSQLSGPPNPQDMAQGPWVTFFLDSNQTQTYRVSNDGTSYVAGVGGSGATSFAGLSDKATVDLTTVNTPLATALAALSTAISGKTSSLASATDVATYDLTTHNVPLATALNGKLGAPGGYDAINGVPVLTAGTAPAANAPQNYTVTSAGITPTVSALQADIPALRNGDVIVWSASMGKWVRYAGDPITIAVSGPLTLNDAHNDCTLLLTGTPALTLGTGRLAGFGFNCIGTYTLTLTGGITCPDNRVSGGTPAANGYSFINQMTDTNTYRQDGGKL